MKWKKVFSSQKGLTLTELLAGLSITSIISVLIISYLTNGMMSFNQVNEEVLLHDEANYVMNQFENEIIVAKNIEEVEEQKLYQVTKLMNDKDEDGLKEQIVTIGFKNNEAIIDDQAIHSSKYEITESSIQNKQNYVYVQMKMVDTEAKYELQIELENCISYIDVESGEGGAENNVE